MRAFFNRTLLWLILDPPLDIDWDGPLPSTDCSENTVYVDPPRQPLTDPDYQELCATINPLDSSSEYGLELSLQFVLDKLRGY